jgi:hypothetical protein
MGIGIYGGGGYRSKRVGVSAYNVPGSRGDARWGETRLRQAYVAARCMVFLER